LLRTGSAGGARPRTGEVGNMATGETIWETGKAIGSAACDRAPSGYRVGVKAHTKDSNHGSKPGRIAARRGICGRNTCRHPRAERAGRSIRGGNAHDRRPNNRRMDRRFRPRERGAVERGSAGVNWSCALPSTRILRQRSKSCSARSCSRRSCASLASEEPSGRKPRRSSSSTSTRRTASGVSPATYGDMSSSGFMRPYQADRRCRTTSANRCPAPVPRAKQGQLRRRRGVRLGKCRGAARGGRCRWLLRPSGPFRPKAAFGREGALKQSAVSCPLVQRNFLVRLRDLLHVGMHQFGVVQGRRRHPCETVYAQTHLCAMRNRNAFANNFAVSP
jgi:hypothetical protein